MLRHLGPARVPPPSDGVALLTTKTWDFEKIGVALLTPKNPGFLIGGTTLRGGGHYSQLGGTI